MSKQSERVERNAKEIAKVGLNTKNPEPKQDAPKRAAADKVEISDAARAAQAAVRAEREPEAAAVAEQNIESVLVDNKQAEIAYKAAAKTLSVVNEMEGALLDQVAKREV